MERKAKCYKAPKWNRCLYLLNNAHDVPLSDAIPGTDVAAPLRDKPTM